jgi:hypothetical protein
MDIGSFVHLAIASRWTGTDPLRAVNIAVEERTEKVYAIPGIPEEEKEEIVTEAYTNGKIAQDVYERWEEWFCPDGWKPLCVEEKLEVTLPNGDNFWCIVDFVGISPDGITDCIDWKVRSASLEDPDRHQYPLQQTTYAHVLTQKGVKVDRISIVQMRGKIAGTPKTNKNGTISRSAITTTWERYCEALEQADPPQDPDDYLDMKDKLDTIVWHTAHGNFWDPEKLQRVWDEVVMPRVERLQGRWRKTNKNPPLRTAWGTFRCQRCAYSELCISELLGYDFDMEGVFEVKLPSKKR